MGYLNNQVVTVDAILTTKGRELLARGDGSFNIRSFALSDDEIDYTLYNPTNPSGSAYYGEAIQNMPLLEAFPDGEEMMKYKLVTLDRDTAVMPILKAGGLTLVALAQTGTSTVIPQTQNYLGSVTEQQEASGYQFTVSDVRQFSTVQGNGIPTTAATNLNDISMQTNGTNVSRTVIGNTCTLTATGVPTLFGQSGNTTSTLYSTLTIIGLDSGARLQIPIIISRTTQS
tara:strand:- start:2941 stop:3627 length:687 start_codon:yes stop_codon:yes gene_type:complete